jgi:hypothetical protein
MAIASVEPFNAKLIRIDPGDPMVALGQGPVIAYRDCPVHELVEAQVDAGPDREAVECAGTTLTYRDLWKAAGAVRELLLRTGLRSGTPVGVTLGRTQLNIVCDEAIEQTEDITITLGPSDYSELVNSDPTVMNYGETAAGVTYGYLLGQFISGSATWAGFGGDYQKAIKSITDMLDISDKIDGYITLRLDDHQWSLDKCTLIVGTVRQRVAALTAESVLGPLLGPLVLYCTGVLSRRTASPWAG